DGEGAVKLYFAGAETYAGVLWEHGCRRLMFSYNALRGSGAEPIPDRWEGERWPKGASQLDWSLDKGADVFVDSGAFSAWRQGSPIDVEEYGEWLQEWGGRMETYANLDVISSPDGTSRNQARLEGMGLSPMPVFHYGSPWRVLEDLYASYDYVGIGIGPFWGPASTFRTANRRLYAFYARVFLEAGGKRVHGFATTLPKLIKAFPFFSVDSTSWMADLRWGMPSLMSRGHLRQVTRSYGRGPWWARAYGKRRYTKRVGNCIATWLAYEAHVGEFHEARERKRRQAKEPKGQEPLPPAQGLTEDVK
ncbi:MAG: hypothetical protein V3U45_03700, partial [bacterium]